MAASAMTLPSNHSHWRLIATLLCALGLGAVVALLPLSISVTVFAAAGLFLLTLVRPVAGLAALALAVPFGSLVGYPFGGLEVGAVEPLVGVLLISSLAAFFARRERRLTVPLGLLPTLPFVAVIAFELTLHSESAPSLKELLRWIELAVVALITANVVRTKKEFAIVLGAVLLGGAAEAVVGWYQFFLRVGPPSFSLGPFLRAYGTFSQPNPFAGYLAMVFPVAVAIGGCWLAARIDSGSARSRRWQGQATSTTGWRPPTTISPLLGLIALLAAVASGAAIVMSFSRGAWLGVVVAGVILSGMYRRRFFLYALATLLLLSVLFLLGELSVLPAPVAARLDDTIAYFRLFDVRTVALTPQNWAIVERMASWQAAWGMFESSPILGIGPGHYDLAYPQFAMPNWPNALGHAHNYYLNVLAEMGALGLGAYSLSLGGWFAAAIAGILGHAGAEMRPVNADGSVSHADKTKTGLDPAFRRVIAAGVIASLAAAVIHNFFDNLYVHGMNVHVALLLGILFASRNSNARLTILRARSFGGG